jgi:hypothetical protein
VSAHEKAAAAGPGRLDRGKLPGGLLSQPLALHFLPLQLAGPAHGLSLLTSALLGRLLVELAGFHLTEGPLALHLLLQRAQGLFDIVVADDDVNDGSYSSKVAAFAKGSA